MREKKVSKRKKEKKMATLPSLLTNQSHVLCKIVGNAVNQMIYECRWH